MVRPGWAVHVVVGLDQLSTRMYGSLGEIVRGWSKNVYAGGRHALPDSRVVQTLLRLLMPMPALWGLVPAIALLLGLLGVVGRDWMLFGAITYGVTTLYGALAGLVTRVPPWYAPLHPLGWGVLGWIYLRAAWSGDRVRWKARDYVSA